MQLLIKTTLLKVENSAQTFRLSPVRYQTSWLLQCLIEQHTLSVVIKRVSCSIEHNLSNVIDYGGHHWKGVIICIATEVNLEQKTFV